MKTKLIVATLACLALAGGTHLASADSPAPKQNAPAQPHPGHKGPAADKGAQAAGGAPSAFDKMPALGTKATCAVSKEAFTVTAKTQSAAYNGKTYVFCCADCKPDFDKNPAKFVSN